MKPSVSPANGVSCAAGENLARFYRAPCVRRRKSVNRAPIINGFAAAQSHARLRAGAQRLQWECARRTA